MANDPLTTSSIPNSELSFEEFRLKILEDYRLGWVSRHASLIGRKEVLTGKAKFGIFGDGKEVAQLALAKVFKPGDIRSGYYRDQTIVFATGMGTVEQFYAQLYANTDLDEEPHSGGRQMNAHFATRTLDANGHWLPMTSAPQSSADSSPTASQMVRALGLAQASKLYRNNPAIDPDGGFSRNGDEVVFCTIGDASTSEGVFWETINAAGVLQVPLAINIWDDGYGISVPRKYQTTKDSISEVLSGFAANGEETGYDIYTCKGWDYAGLVETYALGIARMRETHRPAIFHIQEVTQPQGHSTSGSHERYKSKERLQWETDFDCLTKMREWMLANSISSEAELDEIESEAKKVAQQARKSAWEKYKKPIEADRGELGRLLDELAAETALPEVAATAAEIRTLMEPFRRDLIATATKALMQTIDTPCASRANLKATLDNYIRTQRRVYQSHLHSESSLRATAIQEVAPVYDEQSESLNGYEVLNRWFDAMFTKDARLVAFGEDLGKIGDVNQGFAGLQEKHGVQRIFDTGIREATIMGQGIGLAMRGLRPIAEIQYLDYLIYGLQPLVDDLATLQYRTRGGQKAPLIIRTRGHRLEGIWHTGSPMGMIIHSLRGVHVCVPRSMVQAAGMYQTLLQSDEPGLVIECLNGYRLKEQVPHNLEEFTVPLGRVEVLQEGTDVTLITYGSCVRIAQDAIRMLQTRNISVELIDVQTLLPFDLDHRLVESLAKTNKVLFLDEDVPGGATAYMMQQVLEVQGGYQHLDAAPCTLSARPHRAAYASDGDYFCKPNAEDIFATIYAMMREYEPARFPEF